MSKFVRAVSLRIDGFLVVLGGFLIFASMSRKNGIAAPASATAGGFVSSR
jgi:hypothetical protein